MLSSFKSKIHDSITLRTLAAADLLNSDTNNARAVDAKSNPAVTVSTKEKPMSIVLSPAPSEDIKQVISQPSSKLATDSSPYNGVTPF